MNPEKTLEVVEKMKLLGIFIRSDMKWSSKTRNLTKKSRIRETENLTTDADSSTDVFVSAGFKKGADRNFLSYIASVASVE